MHFPRSSWTSQSAPASLSMSFCPCSCSRPGSPPTSGGCWKMRRRSCCSPSLALWPFGRVSLVVCLLLGSVVSTTDPAAVIAIFRDIGAPARLTRLVEGEALLNDAAAIALFAVLLGMIGTARELDIGSGLREFFMSFVGGGLFGMLAGRALLAVIPMVRDDRLAEATLTLALAYGVFIVAERLLHVSGVVAVLASALTISALGRSRIAPYNWSFLTDLWDQIAFWARSLIFVLAAILVPKLLGS